MHELGLCSSIVDAIEQRAGERPVARVRVQVGRLHHVHPEAFDQSFARRRHGHGRRGRRRRAGAPAGAVALRGRAATAWDGEEMPARVPDLRRGRRSSWSAATS